MFDHLGIVVADLGRAQIFYEAVLGAIGVHLIQDNRSSDHEGWLVFAGATRSPFFVVAAGRPSYWDRRHRVSASPIHLAFAASNRKAVDEFHRRGLALGGTCNGAPGKRSAGMDGKGYYAAYVVDVDGNNIEAGVRRP